MSDKPCSEFCPFSACHACPWKGGKCLSDQVPPTTLEPHTHERRSSVPR